MVVRLEGKLEGKQIIFNWIGGDRWQSVIPKNLNGRYIVDLTAYDEAGNIGYCTKYILTIDLTALCVHLEPYPYWTEIKEAFETCAIVSGFYAELLERYCSIAKISDYYAELGGVI